MRYAESGSDHKVENVTGWKTWRPYLLVTGILDDGFQNIVGYVKEYLAKRHTESLRNRENGKLLSNNS